MSSANDSGQQVLRLMGASLCLLRGSVVQKLLAMRREICGLNAVWGVRSALLYSAGWFLQWHEGPPAAVEKAWEVWGSHPGHSYLRVLHRSRGTSSLAEPIHIATLHNHEKPTDVARRFHALREQAMQGRFAEPAQIWRILSAPCQALQAQGAAMHLHREIVAIASEYAESVELIRALAERYAAQVSYQRFAGSDCGNADSGAAYVDLAGAEGVTRVRALSRRALAQGVVHLALDRTGCVVLLLGARPAPAGELGLAVAGALQRCAAHPAVFLVGAGQDACSAAAYGLRRTTPGLDIQEITPCEAGRASVDAVVTLIHGRNAAATQPMPLAA